jgi:DNA-binding NtrC family response regulator
MKGSALGDIHERSWGMSRPGDRQGEPRQMRVLVVESEPRLGWVWKRHLDRQGCETSLVHGQDAAIECLRNEDFQVIVLDLVLTKGSALAVADFANYRRPEAKVIFVTNTCFFSDGSIFQHATNACAMVNSDAPPSDLAAMVEHFGALSSQTA